MKVNRKKGYFSISAIAKMFSVHQQTIRLYEKEGLIVPKRSEGNTRLFSEDDITKLEEIIHLTHKLGINIAGVEMILKLKKQIHKMQKEMNDVFDTAQEELNKEVETSKHVIKASAVNLMKIKQEKQPMTRRPSTATPASTSTPASTYEEHKETELGSPSADGAKPLDIDSWEIEYDDD